MGYKRTPKLYRLTWDDDTEYPGLEVVVRSLSTGQMLAARRRDDGQDGVAAAVDLLADRLVSWNLEDEDGSPVPTTHDAVLGEDYVMIDAIVDRWIEAVAGVPAPLEQTSTGGESSPEVSIPMEPLSSSLAS